MEGVGGRGWGVGLGLVGAAYPGCTVMCIVSNMIRPRYALRLVCFVRGCLAGRVDGVRGENPFCVVR